MSRSTSPQPAVASTPLPARDQFSTELGRFQSRWRGGLFLAGLIRACLLAGTAFLAIGIFDFYAGLSEAGRLRASQVLLVLSISGFLWAFWDVITFARRDAAVAADAALQGRRSSILSAVELEHGAEETAMGRWLREQSVLAAATELSALPPARSRPMAMVARRLWQIILLTAVFGFISGFFPVPFQTITQRLMQPSADIPPYSKLVFSLSPQPAEVLYGAEILITCSLTGGQPDQPVRCLTRNPETRVVEESPAFQENAGRFSRKLEKVASPVEVAFAVGSARSRWLPVQVRMQPKIQEVLVTVQPPSYSGRPKQEFLLGTQELRALPGSRIAADFTSNRPLASGQLHIQGQGGAKKEIGADRLETHRVRFSWVVKEAGVLAFTVRDIRGTDSDALQAELKLLPDERPEVAMRQPAGEMLATPDIELPLEATATDDLGLTRVALVRKLVGYRERAVSDPVARGDLRHDINGKLNLAAFGVVPGQTIELSLEAADTNPSMLGVSVSEPARIHIITRDKYAEILRSGTTLEEFSARFEAMRAEMEEARKALDELEKAAKSGDEAKAQAARQKAFDAHQKAAKVFGQIAKDFPIFEMDQDLADASLDVAKRLMENGKELEGLSSGSAQDIEAAVPEMKKRLGEAEQRAEKEMKKGEEVAAAGKVMEQTSKFSEVIRRQRELVRDMERAAEQIRRGETDAASALKDLAKRQRELAGNLRELEKELEQALKELPEGFEKFREQGEEFLTLLRESNAPALMDEAGRLADAANSREAWEKSSEALMRLEDLLKKDNGMCKACRGENPGFPWPQELAPTLNQLMQSLIPKPGDGPQGGNKPGQGAEGSAGGSGSSDNGYSMPGKLPRLPIHGPNRSSFARQAGNAAAGNQGAGTSGKGAPGDDAKVGANAMDGAKSRQSRGEGRSVEAVPEAYRNAVKRYFAPETSSENRKP